MKNLKSKVRLFSFFIGIIFHHLQAANAGEDCSLTAETCGKGSFCDEISAVVTSASTSQCKGRFAACNFNEDCCSNECTTRGNGEKTCEPQRKCKACTAEFEKDEAHVGCCPGLTHQFEYCVAATFPGKGSEGFKYTLGEDCRPTFSDPLIVASAINSRIKIYAFEMLFLSHYHQIQTQKNEGSWLNFNANGHNIAKAHFLVRMPYGKVHHERSQSMKEKLKKIDSKTMPVDYYLGMAEYFHYQVDFLKTMSELYKNLTPMLEHATMEIDKHDWGSNQIKCGQPGSRKDGEFGDYCQRKCPDQNICCHELVHRSDEMCVKKCVRLTDNDTYLIDPMIPISSRLMANVKPSYSNGANYLKKKFEENGGDPFLLIKSRGNSKGNFFQLEISKSSLETFLSNGKNSLPANSILVDKSFCPDFSDPATEQCLWSGNIITSTEFVTPQLHSSFLENGLSPFREETIHLKTKVQVAEVKSSDLRENLKAMFKEYAEKNQMDLMSSNDQFNLSKVDEVNLGGEAVYNLLLDYSNRGSPVKKNDWHHECHYLNKANSQRLVMQRLLNDVADKLVKFYGTSALAWKEASQCMLGKAKEASLTANKGTIAAISPTPTSATPSESLSYLVQGKITTRPGMGGKLQSGSDYNNDKMKKKQATPEELAKMNYELSLNNLNKQRKEFMDHYGETPAGVVILAKSQAKEKEELEIFTMALLNGGQPSTSSGPNLAGEVSSPTPTPVDEVTSAKKEQENLRKFMEQQSGLSIHNDPGKGLFEIISRAYLKIAMKKMLEIPVSE